MEVIIVGAGPSGLVSGIFAQRSGKDSLILEANDRPGKKLLATGNGRCNYSNENIKIERYHGQNPKFAYSALAEFPYAKAVEFFSSLGMDTRVLSKNRAYPRSLQSSSVLDVLLMEYENCGGRIVYNSKLDQVKKTDKGFVLSAGGRTYQADSLVLATGGRTLARSGSDGSGYKLAKSLGHSITKLGVGIVQIRLKDGAFKDMSGSRFDAGLSLLEEEKKVFSYEDEVLFTDYGISGPAVLQLSRRALDILDRGKRAYFSLDLYPEMSKEDLAIKLSYDFSMSKNKLGQAMIGKINDNLIDHVLEDFDTMAPAASLDYNQIERIAGRLKDWRFEIGGYKEIDSAQVTTGGIDTKEINPSTMESKLVDGLYFAGELIDIDGDCGGFNLHWAWASGYLAGKSIR